MANKNQTVFQRLGNIMNIFGAPQTMQQAKNISTYNAKA